MKKYFWMIVKLREFTLKSVLTYLKITFYVYESSGTTWHMYYVDGWKFDG